jgi:hypothetical protein
MRIENVDLRLRVSRQPLPQDMDLVLSFREELDERKRSRPDKLLSHIANVVNHGGLCGSTNAPVSSALVVRDAAPTPGLETKRLLRIQGLDPGAWRVILGSIVSASVRGFPVQRLELTARNENLLEPLQEEEAFGIAYPEAPESLPFRLKRSVFGSSTKDRLIRIGFANPLPEEVTRELISALLSWDELLWGGFPLDGQSPLENVADAIEPYLIDPLTVEHPLPGYVGSDSAFDAVICMALWFHTQRTWVEQVTLR